MTYIVQYMINSSKSIFKLAYLRRNLRRFVSINVKRFNQFTVYLFLHFFLSESHRIQWKLRYILGWMLCFYLFHVIFFRFLERGEELYDWKNNGFIFCFDVRLKIVRVCFLFRFAPLNLKSIKEQLIVRYSW